MRISIVAAIGKNGEIGMEGNLPWSLPEDQKYFKKLTRNHTVIMGRKTFESILNYIGRPLPERKNIIVTRNPNYRAPDGCVVVNSLEDALRVVEDESETFIIGGAEIYAQALPIVERMYITAIDKEFSADAFFPKIDLSKWKVVETSAGHRSEAEATSFSYLVYERTEDTIDLS